MKVRLLTQLKIGVFSSEKIQTLNSLSSIAGLAFNEQHIGKKQCVLYLGIALFEFGSEQTRNFTIETLPLQFIRELTHFDDQDLQEKSFILLSWVSSQEEMTKYQEIKQDLKGQNVLKDAKDKIEDKGGLVITVLEVAKELIFQDNDFIPLSVDFGEDNEFIDSLFQFQDALSPEQATGTFTQILIYIMYGMEKELQDMKRDKYIIPLVKLLQIHPNKNDLYDITCFISRVVTSFEETGKIQINESLLDIFVENGGLEKLVNYLKDDEIENERIKQHLAVIIGSLHKAVKIPDDFREVVINNLKSLPEDDDDDELIHLQVASLSRLAENEENHEDIISGNFSENLIKYISSEVEDIVDQEMMLALNLLQFGSQQVRLKVKEGVPWDVVKQLQYNEINIEDDEDDDDNDQKKVKITAELLDQWIISIQ
ncbi:MAG: hypothetical protein EZS28_029301 [Streblomastix strix]|uniref:Uncharacterized protein n=1 Tax=Streblomastix strix TaxID=222440 RepID=A0A5J4UY68_9EUKA|nr:MAG: hypothetical protein EZS28_029301 [Streblomastix strix]